MKGVLKCLFGLAWAGTVLLAVWCVGAIWFQSWVTAAAGKVLLMALFALAVVVSLVLSLRRRRWLAVGAALSVGVCSAWSVLYRPDYGDGWNPSVAVMPKVTFSPDGGSCTIENIRDFHYRSAKDFDVRYRTQTYSFGDLESMDYSITYWNGNELFGHIILIFNFGDGRHLCISPEVRLKQGQKFGLLAGLYRQFALIFVIATEEDVLQLRTNHRRYEQSKVFVYPMRPYLKNIRFVFRDILSRAEAMRARPEYYNVLTRNCLSSIAPSAEKVGVDFFSGWRGPINGISGWAAWELGFLRDTKPGESFEDYNCRHFINQYVEHLVDPADYSRLIRVGMAGTKEKCP